MGKHKEDNEKLTVNNDELGMSKEEVEAITEDPFFKDLVTFRQTNEINSKVAMELLYNLNHRVKELEKEIKNGK